MTPEQRAARERKQKIFVAVGGVVLLILLAIQLPKILGGGTSGSEAVAKETAPTATTPPATPATSSPGVPAAAPGGEVAFSSARGAKLQSFTVFAKKDPFVQQVVTAPAAAPSGGSGSKTKGAERPSGEKVPSQGFTTSPSASVTVIRVNGSSEAVAPGAAFPSTDPVFVLVAEQPRKKTVTVGIAGGAYASGAKTIVLAVGKPVVLENTATGATYKLVLVSVGNGAGASPAKGSPSPSPPAGTDTP